MNSQGTAETKSKSESTPVSTPKLTVWHVALAITVLLILSGFSAWVVDHYQTDTATNAATILGIVIPAFATIGAAAFGVTIAYKAGQAQGQASGKEEGQAAQAEAVTTARTKATEILGPHIDEAERALGAFAEHVASRSFSPPDESRVMFGLRAAVESERFDTGALLLEPEPVEVNLDPLNTARASLLQAKGAIEALRE